MEPQRERRRYRRLPYSLPLQYRNIDEGSGHFSGGLTKNISEGGIRFVSQRFLPIATNLDLTINTPTSPRPLRATSRVVWIHKAPTGEYYEVGLQFTSIKEEEREAIRRLEEEEDRRGN
jgi:c-di-GMP-binding flagellar brake protein YcgR